MNNLENIQIKSYKKFFKKIPLGLSGLALGIGGLGNAWSIGLQNLVTNRYDGLIAIIVIQTICIFLLTICLSLVLLRFFFNVNSFKEEIKHPLMSGFLPTIPMSIACIGNYIGFICTRTDLGFSVVNNQILNVGTIFANIIIVFSLVVHFILLVLFFINIIKKHNIKMDTAYASWFVPAVGITLSVSFVPDLGYLIPLEFFQIFWYLGFILFILLFPLITYKIIFFQNIESHTTPSLAIYLSAPNLLLISALNMFATNSHNIVGYFPTYYSEKFVYIICIILFLFSVFSILFFIITLVKIFKTKFNFTYSSLTFPTAVASGATIRFADIMLKGPQKDLLRDSFYDVIHVLGLIYLVSSTILIAYIAIRYWYLIITNSLNKKKRSNIKH